MLRPGLSVSYPVVLGQQLSFGAVMHWAAVLCCGWHAWCVRRYCKVDNTSFAGTLLCGTKSCNAYVLPSVMSSLRRLSLGAGGD
jgi:hypothetical protein